MLNVALGPGVWRPVYCQQCEAEMQQDLKSVLDVVNTKQVGKIP